MKSGWLNGKRRHSKRAGVAAVEQFVERMTGCVTVPGKVPPSRLTTPCSDGNAAASIGDLGRDRRAGVERPRRGVREQQSRRELREAVEQRLDAHLGCGGRQRRADRGDGQRGDDRVCVVAHHARPRGRPRAAPVARAHPRDAPRARAIRRASGAPGGHRRDRRSARARRRARPTGRADSPHSSVRRCGKKRACSHSSPTQTGSSAARPVEPVRPLHEALPERSVFPHREFVQRFVAVEDLPRVCLQRRGERGHLRRCDVLGGARGDHSCIA